MKSFWKKTQDVRMIVARFLFFGCALSWIQALCIWNFERVLGYTPHGIFGISRWWDLALQPVTVLVILFFGILSHELSEQIEEDLRESSDTFMNVAISLAVCTTVSFIASISYGVGLMVVAFSFIIIVWICVLGFERVRIGRKIIRRSERKKTLT